jgi:large subunit ribosomal protein L35
MPKQKTKKALAKRVKVTARGKVLRNRPGASHLKSRKSPSRIRRFRQEREVPASVAKKIKQAI